MGRAPGLAGGGPLPAHTLVWPHMHREPLGGNVSAAAALHSWWLGADPSCIPPPPFLFHPFTQTRRPPRTHAPETPPPPLSSG
jgi:hypothetical protein